MRRNERTIKVKKIEQEYINTNRLVEYFANKYKERCANDGL